MRSEDLTTPAAQATLLGSYHVSAFLGATAVAFRQTNAVWVAFILGMAVLNEALERDPQAKQVPAEKQLMQLLRTCWKVSSSVWPAADIKRPSVHSGIEVSSCAWAHVLMAVMQPSQDVSFDVYWSLQPTLPGSASSQVQCTFSICGCTVWNFALTGCPEFANFMMAFSSMQ